VAVVVGGSSVAVDGATTYGPVDLERTSAFCHGSERVDAMSVLVQIEQQIGGRIGRESNRLGCKRKTALCLIRQRAVDWTILDSNRSAEVAEAATACADPRVYDSAAGPKTGPILADPELQALVDAWPKLSESTRQQIVALTEKRLGAIQ